MENLNQIITDEQLEKAFENTSYGTNPDVRLIIKWALMKVACGYANGHTSKCIIQELGLCTKKSGLTSKGKQYLYRSFEY